jgi:hypothetical protein
VSYILYPYGVIRVYHGHASMPKTGAGERPVLY